MHRLLSVDVLCADPVQTKSVTHTPRSQTLSLFSSGEEEKCSLDNFEPPSLNEIIKLCADDDLDGLIKLLNLDVSLEDTVASRSDKLFNALVLDSRENLFKKWTPLQWSIFFESPRVCKFIIESCFRSVNTSQIEQDVEDFLHSEDANFLENKNERRRSRLSLRRQSRVQQSDSRSISSLRKASNAHARLSSTLSMFRASCVDANFQTSCENTSEDPKAISRRILNEMMLFSLYYGNIDAVILLLRHGANPLFLDKDKNSSLQLAAIPSVRNKEQAHTQLILSELILKQMIDTKPSKLPLLMYHRNSSGNSVFDFSTKNRSLHRLLRGLDNKIQEYCLGTLMYKQELSGVSDDAIRRVDVMKTFNRKSKVDSGTREFLISLGIGMVSWKDIYFMNRKYEALKSMLSDEMKEGKMRKNNLILVEKLLEEINGSRMSDVRNKDDLIEIRDDSVKLNRVMEDYEYISSSETDLTFKGLAEKLRELESNFARIQNTEMVENNVSAFEKYSEMIKYKKTELNIYSVLKKSISLFLTQARELIESKKPIKDQNLIVNPKNDIFKSIVESNLFSNLTLQEEISKLDIESDISLIWKIIQGKFRLLEEWSHIQGELKGRKNQRGSMLISNTHTIVGVISDLKTRSDDLNTSVNEGIDSFLGRISRFLGFDGNQVVEEPVEETEGELLLSEAVVEFVLLESPNYFLAQKTIRKLKKDIKVEQERLSENAEKKSRKKSTAGKKKRNSVRQVQTKRPSFDRKSSGKSGGTKKSTRYINVTK